MEVCTTLAELDACLLPLRRDGLSVGLVPTMGALHAGHASLLAAANRDNDRVVCSLYVNPTQFNNPADLASYPRPRAADLAALAATADCHVAFTPTDAVVYPQPTRLTFDFGHLERTLEGQFRPGHFNGVATVVSKLFHLVQPDRAYFGQKDLQQVLVIEQLLRDLSFRVRVVRCPTLRETDGLAMSSRNARLTARERARAPVLYQTLRLAAEWLRTHSVAEVSQKVAALFDKTPGVRLEYFAIADGQDLSEVTNVKQHASVALCVAAYLGEVRLIDNLVLELTTN